MGSANHRRRAQAFLQAGPTLRQVHSELQTGSKGSTVGPLPPVRSSRARGDQAEEQSHPSGDVAKSRGTQGRWEDNEKSLIETKVCHFWEEAMPNMSCI